MPVEEECAELEARWHDAYELEDRALANVHSAELNLEAAEHAENAAAAQMAACVASTLDFDIPLELVPCVVAASEADESAEAWKESANIALRLARDAENKAFNAEYEIYQAWCDCLREPTGSAADPGQWDSMLADAETDVDEAESALADSESDGGDAEQALADAEDAMGEEPDEEAIA